MVVPEASCRAIGSVAGVFEAIVGAMRRHEDEADVAGAGCEALAGLSHNGGTWHLCLLRACGAPRTHHLGCAAVRCQTAARLAAWAACSRSLCVPCNGTQAK